MRLAPATRWLAMAALASAAHAAAFAQAAGATPSPGAAALRARYDGLADKLAHNAFGRPVVLESKQDASRLQGEIVARVDQPFPMVQKALQGTDNWCAI